MSQPPSNPRIYHVTHLNNLVSIIADGCLWSDREQLVRRPGATIVGMSQIKQRRLTELVVDCHPSLKVGDFVPFNYCPRSFMLYVIHCANHPSLAYRGGQAPMLHFEADLHEVLHWAYANQRRWALTPGNAGARATRHYNRVGDFTQIDWHAVEATDFRSPTIKEGKQAEFLLHESFPWQLVRRIGVRQRTVLDAVQETLAGAAHRPLVEVLPDWYY